MLSFDNQAALVAALDLPLDPILHGLLTARINDALVRGLGELTHIVVVQPGDTEADIIETIGFSPLVHRIYGTRHDDPCYQPDWDWCKAHDGWTELGYCVGDSGFAYLLFIQDANGVFTELLSLC